MASVICISDYTHIVYKKIFQASEAQDIAREPYLILDFVYNIDGERVVEGITAESRHRFAECDPSSVRAFIEGKEPLPLDTMVDPEEAEIVRETVSDAIASLVRDCAGVEGLKTLQVDVIVEIDQQEEEDYGLMELDDAESLRERRMNLLQKNVYIGAAMAEKENKFCVICFDEFKEGEEVVCTPCVHWFHDACLGRWFEKTNLCPLCRSKIVPF